MVTINLTNESNTTAQTIIGNNNIVYNNNQILFDWILIALFNHRLTYNQRIARSAHIIYKLNKFITWFGIRTISIYKQHLITTIVYLQKYVRTYTCLCTIMSTSMYIHSTYVYVHIRTYVCTYSRISSRIKFLKGSYVRTYVWM